MGWLLGCFVILGGFASLSPIMAQDQQRDQQSEFSVLQTSPEEGGLVNDERQPVKFTFSDTLDPASLSTAEMLVVGTLSGLHTTQQCEQLNAMSLQCKPSTPLIAGENLQVQLRPTLQSVKGQKMTQPVILNLVVSPLLTSSGLNSTPALGWSPTETPSSNTMSAFPDIPQLGIQGEEIELLADKAESFLFDRMGFQEFGYASVKRGSARATELRAGWQMNERTQLWFVQEVRSAYPSNRFVLEFDMNENLDVLLTQGDQRWQGIDIRWKKEY
ncbi:MAG: hypothetical protein RI513_03360 [Balneolaceae bacterium]|nr:hypothetical protein [Balneolaceae bacterium]